MNLAHEDDGIIDLRALKSTPPRPGTFAAFPMGSPFGSEPPPAAFARDRDAGEAGGLADGLPARSSKAKTIGIAAGAALFLILGAVGVGFAFRGEKPVKISSAAATPVAPPPVVVAPPAPVADPAPAPAAQAAASTADDSSTDAASTRKAKGGKVRAGGAGKSKASSGFSSSVASAPASKPIVTKAADPCHCHGDFQCNIRCSANR